MRASLALLLTVTFAFAEDEVQMYNRVGTVVGEVTIVNHPTLGKTPCRSCQFLFRSREGCLMLVQTDADGRYRVRIGLGEWRVIMKSRDEGAAHSYDMLSPKQSRNVRLTTPLEEKRFDIAVVVPAEE